jgi:signal transduction histidine kinase
MSSEPEQRIRTPLSRLPIRLRLATAVALVVFAILTVIGTVVGILIAEKLRSDFYAQVGSEAQNVADLLHPHVGPDGIWRVPDLELYPAINNGVARVFNGNHLVTSTSNTPNLGLPTAASHQSNGYVVATAPITTGNLQLILEYGVPVQPLAQEIRRLELLLALGVVTGTVLAFGAGAVVARRAIMPIAELTAAAAEIEQTGDPDRTLPEPTADDEVAELTHTLSGMLASLSAARNETEETLERQRAFVADASHELRTPLTSVLANLELLVESVDGADRELAQSALRSTQRMRRLVGDLLLLARADAHRVPSRQPLDLADIVIEAASELEPAARDHSLSLDVRPTPTLGSRDDLQRVATNLIENAMRHTPPGTHVIASTRALPDGGAELVVADDGPGIASDVRDTLFQRFVRGAGDRGGSFGLGLAIVAAVTQAHGGTVAVDQSPHGGARFTVVLPPAEPADAFTSEPSRDIAPADEQSAEAPITATDPAPNTPSQ